MQKASRLVRNVKWLFILEIQKKIDLKRSPILISHEKKKG